MAKDIAQGADGGAWLECIKLDIANLQSTSTRYTICKVPFKLRNEKNDAYSPQTISIGPLHNPKNKSKENLKAMQEHKLSYMLSLLERTRNETDALEACGKATLDLDAKVRPNYEEKVEHSETELARMLLVDGCFILELFIRYYINDLRPDDPILLNPRMISVVRRDLALLENQIPFIVLEELFKVIQDHSDITLPELNDLAISFFKLDRSRKGSKSCHLLDLIHSCYSPDSASKHATAKGEWKVMQCATKLSSLGIKFARPGIEKNHKKKGIEVGNDSKKDLFDLKFEKGTMKIRQLCVENSLFQNLIAMEQCLHGREHYMTSYALLMDFLVDSSKDVEFLVNKGIIPHNFGDYEEVAHLFNNIGKQVVVRDFYFAGTSEAVVNYCKTSWWLRYVQSLLRDYLANPWMATSVVAAIILLVATLLQTVYSVLSYYHR
ncbi:hypothetical protein Peur_064560 [Populus x canadensis]|jgi:hypothetical protein|uniref:Uncharacterized protein n=1 Tax=Populus deltoides TaxID=3696 RepID=A0A8T2WSS5_POPDE|nr:hypothetical protein H0E87_027700 [Populus deltoides]